MANRALPRLRPDEERRFGLLVGAGFIVLAGLATWRQVWAAPWLGVAGVLLLLAGAIAPTLLRSVFRAWMALGRLLSRVTVPVMMGVFYFVVITPLGLAKRLLDGNPIYGRSAGRGRWVDRADEDAARERMERQF